MQSEDRKERHRFQYTRAAQLWPTKSFNEARNRTFNQMPRFSSAYELESLMNSKNFRARKVFTFQLGKNVGFFAGTYLITLFCSSTQIDGIL